MTKAGKKSPVRDIRYFFGSRTSYAEACHEATAFGRRVALLLRSMGRTFGAWSHLYVYATESDKPSQHVVLYDGLDWWHRYIEVNVPRGFPGLTEFERNQILMDRTRTALKFVLAEYCSDVDAACDEARDKGDALRFLVKRKVIGDLKIEVSFNIATWPSASNLLVTVTNLHTDLISAVRPVDLRFYADVAGLVGDVRRSADSISILPKDSFTARLTARAYSAPLVLPLAKFEPLSELPAVSKLIDGPI